METIENGLQEEYRKKWDSVNVYAKHIGKTESGVNCFVVFQIERMSGKIIQQEHVLVESH